MGLELGSPIQNSERLSILLFTSGHPSRYGTNSTLLNFDGHTKTGVSKPKNICLKRGLREIAIRDFP